MKLTKESDRLPALSGLASTIVKATEDTYLAGLWENDIILGLQWYNMQGEKDGNKSYLPPAYRAPTWSWASIECPSLDFTLRGIREEYIIHANLLETRISPLGKDPLGEVSQGDITLRGPVLSAMLRVRLGAKTRFEYAIQSQPTTDGAWIDLKLLDVSASAASSVVFHPDVDLNVNVFINSKNNILRTFTRSSTPLKPDGRLEKGIQAPVLLLRLSTFHRMGFNKAEERQGKKTTNYLVLGVSTRDSNVYERLGLLWWQFAKVKAVRKYKIKAAAQILELPGTVQTLVIR